MATDVSEAVKRPSTVWGMMRALTAGRRGQMVLLAITSFVGAMLEAGFLFLVTGTVVALANEATVIGPVRGHTISIPVALWIGLAMIVGRLVLNLMASWVSASLAAGVRTEQRRRVASAYLRASWAVQQNESGGRLQELLTTFVGRVNQAVLALTQFVTAAISVVAFMAAGVAVDPVATVVVLGALAVLGFALAPIRSRIRHAATTSAAADVNFATTIAESGQLGREVQTFGVVDATIDRVDVVIDAATWNARHVQWLSGMLAPIYTFAAYAAVLAGVVGLYFADSANMGVLGAVMLLMLRSLSYGQQLVAVSGQLAAAAPSVDQLDEAVEEYESNPAPNGIAQPITPTPIVFEDVSFAYNADRVALADVDFTIADGEMLGVIGPSGAGKSTFAQLLLGLRTSTSGRVTVGGVDLDDVDRAWWTDRVAFVPQDPMLITGTVAENIRFFREEITSVDLRRAAQQANVLADIEALPQGFDTHLGERGSQLSGGQRQRLSIARAMAGNPEVLVLDEPTSALDGKSEMLIRDTMATLHGTVTIVLIAHRMSTLDLCDRLLVIEGGGVTGLGSPADLVAKSAFYREALRVAGLDAVTNDDKQRHP
jgi:ATP-binding cassette subfamily B protein